MSAPAAGGRRRRARVRPVEVALVGAAAAAFLLWPGSRLLLAEIAAFALFALSLDLILGLAGIVSLGHAAFFGVGAYAAGLLAKAGWGEPVTGLLAGAALAALLGLATSPLVLRGSDLTRLMVTLAVALALGEVANQAASLTGGADGLQGVVMGPVLGLFPFDLGGTVAAAYGLLALLLLYLAARRLAGSPFGLSLRAIRDNPLRAAAVGVPVGRRLVGIYAVAAGYAGAAGALSAQATSFASPDLFDVTRSADALLAVVIGGPGALSGAVAGAAAFKLGSDALAGLTPRYWHFWVGLLLVVLVLLDRDRWLGRLRTGAGTAGRMTRRLLGKEPGPSAPA